MRAIFFRGKNIQGGPKKKSVAYIKSLFGKQM